MRGMKIKLPDKVNLKEKLFFFFVIENNGFKVIVENQEILNFVSHRRCKECSNG